MELCCGDILTFPEGQFNKKKYLVREIVNENEKIKYSAEPPKDQDGDNSLINDSCVYHNTDATTKHEVVCRFCGKFNQKNDSLLYLCKSCDDAPIHNKCLNEFVSKYLTLVEDQFGIYYEVNQMICDRCGMEYPSTFFIKFKYKKKLTSTKRKKHSY